MDTAIGATGRQRNAPETAHEVEAPAVRRKFDRRSTLSTLWIFATLNYLYCDVVSLMDRKSLQGYLAGTVGSLHVTQGFLLGATALVEIPIAMVLVSRVARYRPNRWANIAAGTVMTVVQIGTLFAGTPTAYYLFSSVIEIACTAVIVWYAWTWRLAPAAAAVPARRPATP
jgi:MFS family permease